MAPKGIRVNSVNPGVIVTGIFEKAGLTSAQAADYYESCKALHPLGRPGTADEVATAIAFLASKVILKMMMMIMIMVLMITMIIMKRLPEVIRAWAMCVNFMK